MRRTEGALEATQAAMAEGVGPRRGTGPLRARAPPGGTGPQGGRPRGGGGALRAEGGWDAIRLKGDCARGVEVVRSVLAEPLYWIATNAGYDGQATTDQTRPMPYGHGLDALTGEFGDLFDAGVIDPVRVTR